MYPLYLAQPGDRVEVIKVVGGHNFRMRLSNIGLRLNGKYEVISSGRGPIILSDGSTKIALGQGLSNKIFIEEVDE